MPAKIKLTTDEIKCMGLFESITGVAARDCIIDNNSNRIIFVTNPKEAGLAIGKNGFKIKLLRKATGKNIEVIEYSENAQEFIKNAFLPARVKEVRIVEKLNKRKIALVKVENEDKGIAIGKGGERVEKVRKLIAKFKTK